MRNRMERVSQVAERLDVGYRAERATPCVCGGFVVAPPNNERAVELAVEHHQRTLRHMNWWARAGW